MAENNASQPHSDKPEALFSVPLSEKQRLLGTPIQWTCGGLVFNTRLFPYIYFEIFNKLAHALRIREKNTNLQLTLLEFFESIDKTELTDQTPTELLTDALRDFQEQYGFLPNDLVQLVISVTDPNDPEKCYNTIYRWLQDFSMGIPPSLQEFNKREVWVEIVSYYCKHFISPLQIATLVEEIIKANTTVKKKLGAVEEQGLENRSENQFLIMQARKARMERQRWKQSH